jgi:chemotaxis signal transduction protein
MAGAASLPWVLFRLGEVLYGVPAGRVTEMVIAPPASRVPNTPAAVRGVINLRGRIIALYDMRATFGLNTAAADRDAFIELLEARKQDHIRWLDTLEDAIQTDRPFKLSLDPHGCAFGKWYDQYRPTNVLMEMHLKRFKEPHDRIHALGAKAIEAARTGDRAGATSMIQAHRASTLNRLIELFDGAKGILEQTNREIVVVLSCTGHLVGAAVDAIESVEHLRDGSIADVEGLACGMVRQTGRTLRGDRLVLLVSEEALDRTYGSAGSLAAA